MNTETRTHRNICIAFSIAVPLLVITEPAFAAGSDNAVGEAPRSDPSIH